MSANTPPSETSTPPGPTRLQYNNIDTTISKAQMNRMIMDYLVKHGYSQAAKDFAREAGLPFNIKISTIERRKKIKNAIYAGNLQVAIEAINELNPDILEQDKDLHFQLLNLQLIEIIKEENPKGTDCDIQKCVTFAQENLAPRAPMDPRWKDMLEKTMALMVFEHDDLMPALSALISQDHRIRVAVAANKAILRATGESLNSGLVELLQTRIFAQKEAERLNTWPAGGMDIGLSKDSGEHGDLMPLNDDAQSDDEHMAE